jgi:hypothetical protein
MAKEEFQYCSTCGIAEHPKCTECGTQFWHRAMGAYINAGARTGVPKHLCPKCAKAKGK